MALSKAQIKAVTHREGPAMVLAGPGSGKTTVITYRTRYLIQECEIPPIHILVVTFTKAAAMQMKERFLKLSGEQATQVRFGTFHSVFFEILRKAYHLTAENIAGEDLKYRFLKEILESLHVEAEDENDLLRDVVREISIVKNEQIPLEHYYAANVPEEIFREIYKRYCRRMEQENLLDYDDLMTWTWELLNQRKDILEGWRDRFRYILVDEFQDINKLQYKIIQLLAAPRNNLFVVGDDDQSIYRFRGAKPEIMLGFPKEYPDAVQILLNQNFRCPGNVMEIALDVIGRNTVRFPKNFERVKEPGEPVEVRLYQNQTQESLGIIREMQLLLKKGYHYNDFAVLYRNNTDAGVLSLKLMEYNVPFTMRDSIPDLYEHWITKHIKAYLKAAMGSRKRQDILKIINRPKRYIGRECLDGPEVDFEKLRCYYEEKYWVTDRIDKLEQDLVLLKKMDPYTAVNYIRHGIGYEKYLEEYADYRNIRAEDLFEILDRLSESAKDYASFEEWFAAMEEYSEKLKEMQQKEKKKLDAVTLTTLHSAKGLEFPVVFLIDVNEGIIPGKKALLHLDIEEERRMFYVGLTRASDRLCICLIKEKNGKSIKPSPFLRMHDNPRLRKAFEMDG
ncbi:MAG: ATP-dependent helicase [Eubacteriales bacterium]|nr:ATP-dependent helicase [Eubacteriales bacterium]